MTTLAPPPQYDIPPPMPVIERVVPFSVLQAECMKTNPLPSWLLERGGHYEGCAAVQVKNGKVVSCTVWFTEGDRETLRHERAHCAGWPKDHPGGK